MPDLSKNLIRIRMLVMTKEPKNSAEEIEEIKRRIDYLVRTDQISVSDKIAIAKKALEIIEKSEAEKEAVQ